MDSIEKLILKFKSENTKKLKKIDDSIKPDIVSELEDFDEDDRVVDFFVATAVDDAEYDLGRIEILKVFEVAEYSKAKNRKKVSEAICEVLTKCADDLVLNYAAMA